MEKIQMCGFFIQEVVLSSIYIFETVRILRSSLQPHTRKTMQQLIFVNALIILLDLGLLGLEAASLYIFETLFKGVIYSIKLKLEFAILGKLVNFVGGSKSSAGGGGGDGGGGGGTESQASFRKNSVGFVGGTAECRTSGDELDMNVNDFVDLSKVPTNVTNPSRHSASLPSARKSWRARGSLDPDVTEYDFARFEHVEDVATLKGHLSPPTAEGEV